MTSYTESALEMRDFWDDQQCWSYETFGPPDFRGPIGALKHLEKEAKEAYEATENDRREEIADCLFLVFDAAHRSGMSYRELAETCKAKLEKNLARTWPNWRDIDPLSPSEHDRTKD
jgi:hypothetical protein